MSKTGAIVLVGPMGVGKTTIGKKLARLMELPFIDTDQLIVREHGEIPKLFETLGETGFRKIEEDAVLVAISSPAVVATGGGAVLSPQTRTALTQTNVVYLETDGNHMASRLSGGSRPLLQNGMADWRKIYESRRPLYEQVADLTVDTSKLPLRAIVDRILEGLK
jgi:shikimate kinase